MHVRERLRDLGLTLPEAPAMPVTTTFSWIRILVLRALVSGHGPQHPDGTPAGPSAGSRTSCRWSRPGTPHVWRGRTAFHFNV